MLDDHPNRPFPDFRGVLLWLVHDRILSRFGVSGNPGAVHTPCSSPTYPGTLKLLDNEHGCSPISACAPEHRPEQRRRPSIDSNWPDPPPIPASIRFSPEPTFPLGPRSPETPKRPRIIAPRAEEGPQKCPIPGHGPVCLTAHEPSSTVPLDEIGRLGHPMAKKKVADLLVDVLVSGGVRQIYGVSGDSLNGITDSIRAKEQIQWIHVRHEETAAFAAGAEAHLTGRLAVCAGSCGPGNLHLINGLYDCHRSRVPVLAIAAQIPSNEIGSDTFRKPTRNISSRSAATIVNWFLNPSRCPACSRLPCKPHCRGAVLP